MVEIFYMWPHLLIGLSLIVGHAIFAVINVRNLRYVSQRQNKLVWAGVIMLLPFVGSFIYDKTKTRRKRYSVWRHHSS